ncbi:alpha/beta hydrolase [Longispora sp. NPDC051575]|uniref:alpha/beta fold hydrolase n=1 Tax=Longispora sp. NPDC051575 TaxID=3154943 RepID=UPI003442EB73
MIGRARLRRPADGTGPLRTLLVNGLGGSNAVWGPFAERADPRLEIWEADLPWGSEGTVGWGQEPELGPWIRRALESVDSGRVDLVVAHSFGANLLLDLLCRGGLPEPPRAAVLVSPFYRPSPDRFDWETISYFLNNFHLLLQEGIRVRSAGRLDADSQRDLALRLREMVGPYGWVRFFDTYLRTPGLALENLTQSFLIVAGADDPASSPADSRDLADRLPDCQAEILDGCGHLAMVERAERFAHLVNVFSRSIEPSIAQTTGADQP